MDVLKLIRIINKKVDAFDLATARKLIEENIDILNSHMVHLNSNARELLLFINKRLESGEKPLTKNEKKIIRVINSYASDFNIRGLKLRIKNKESFLNRTDVLIHLNSAAKILLKSMGAIKGDHQ